MSTRMKFCAPCLFGLEGILSTELKNLGAEDVQADNGKVTFFGDEEMLVKANLWLRTAQRVLLVLAEFDAETFEELFSGVEAIDFSRYIGADNAFPVKGWSLNSTLASVPACQSIIKKAAVKSLSKVHHLDFFPETGATVQIQFSIHKNHVTIALDTSGAALHKRGWRPQSNLAPIRETLAAGMVWLAHLYDDTTLYDPFCGSGTIVIEGALKALNIAPGINRRFAFEKWLKNGEAMLKAQRAEAVQMVRRDAPFHAYASDIDPACVALTMENARRAGVASRITVKQADVKDFSMHTERGVLITNPPYGERLLDINAAHALYKTMGQVFEPGEGRRFYIISPSEQFEEFFGKKADRKRKLYNGMIKCDLHMYDKKGK